LGGFPATQGKKRKKNENLKKGSRRCAEVASSVNSERRREKRVAGGREGPGAERTPELHARGTAKSKEGGKVHPKGQRKE